MLRTKEVRRVTRMLDDIIDAYKKEVPKPKRDWRTYKQRLMMRIKTATRELGPTIEEAVATLKTVKAEGRGRKRELTLKQKTVLLLLKHLFDRSNRDMSAQLVAFSMLSGIDVGHKTIERLYSDEEVLMVLHNMHVPLLKWFVEDPRGYLHEYFKRNQSESGFSEDKRRFGWKVAQKREDRIDTANFCTMVWHNLFWLG